MYLPANPVDFSAAYRTQLTAALSDLTAYERRQATAFKKRRFKIAGMQDRLLNAFLSGTLEEAVYTAKTNKLKIEVVKANEALDGLGDVDRLRGDRGQQRRHTYLPDVAGFAQPCGQVNNDLRQIGRIQVFRYGSGDRACGGSCRQTFDDLASNGRILAALSDRKCRAIDMESSS